MARRWRAGRALFRLGLVLAISVLAAIGLVAVLLETSWGNDRLRQLAVDQANRYLAATLTIDRLDGSLLRGVRLDGVRLAQNGEPVVTIERVTVGYSLRQLFGDDRSTRLRSLEVVRPHVVLERLPDGRWNLAALLRPRPTQSDRPGRSLALQEVSVVDGSVDLRSPLSFGAIRVPSEIRALDARFSYDSRPGPPGAPGTWTLAFERAAWLGRDPDLVVTAFSGGIVNASRALTLERLRVETPRSAFVVDGEILRQPPPTSLDLAVDAERFAFQEWATLLPGLRNIAVEARFTTRLRGPTSALATSIDMRSTGGDIRGDVTLDATVPGWRGVGQVDLAMLDLARWLNRPDRASNITGRVDFDLDLELGRRFPRGRYTFRGPHVAWFGYQADDLVVSGRLTASDALVSAASLAAYGANVRLDSGSIGLETPFPYRFAGIASGLDLRRLPPKVPLPHVESTLSFGFDVHGRFVDPTIVGRAELRPSTFLDVVLGEGTVGTIDTTTRPVRYTGEGEVSNIALQRLGAGLDVQWMRDPRYAGTIAGHFRIDGSGTEAASLRLAASGRLRQAELFQGTLSDADVTLTISEGTLRATYQGAFDRIDPSIALADPRWRASATGTADVSIQIRDLMIRSVTLDDYEVKGRVALTDSLVRGFPVTEAVVTGTAIGHTLSGTATIDAPSLAGHVEGTLELDRARRSALTYRHAPLDLARLGEWLGRPLSGLATGSGEATGPLDALRLNGTMRVSLPVVASFEALDGSLDYDVVVPVDEPRRAQGRVRANLDRPAVAGHSLDELETVATIDGEIVRVGVQVIEDGVRLAEVGAGGRLDVGRRFFDVDEVWAAWQGLTWEKAAGAAARVEWHDSGVRIAPLAVVDVETKEQRLSVQGSWQPRGDGALQISASRVFLDPIASALARPIDLGGTLDGEVTIRPTADGSVVAAGQGSISSGRFRRVAFDRLTARVGYEGGRLDLDARLDQGPGVWLSVVGQAPVTLFDTTAPPAPVNLSVQSSDVDLALVEGVTTVVRDVGGRARVALTVLGTSHDPHFEGTFDVSGAGFLVRATGARYRNGRAALRLARDRVEVDAFRIEDSRGQALTLTGSLGTHELKVGDFTIDVSSKNFEVLRNEFGTLTVDTALAFRGQFESPRVTGTVTITGGALNVDRILDRTLLRPYATQSAAAPAAPAAGDPLAALNPWERIGLDIAVHTPGTLRMIGEDVQVSPGTPLGLGQVTLRAYGDIYLYKDPGRELFVTGTLDSLVGTYAFQGRRFDIDPDSSVIFRGDLNPELYVTLRRTISAVEARVSIVGPLSDPELRLASTPSLDPSEVLSLIVFNTQLNQLSAGQQQELAVRAGTLAAGFLAAPLINALERSLGLDILEIEPAQPGAGPGGGLGTRVTIGDEIAPGLIARFSRQFGGQEYNEATIEYYLSRLFRIRATFSDAGSVVTSRFRRVERAGIDFLVFFSF